MSSKYSISDTLKEAREKLKVISDSPALDAEILLSYTLKKSQTYLHTWPENTLTVTQQICFLELIEKRLTDYPVAYLVGTKAFWTLDLIVTEDVLIPRPETELLIEIALEKIEHIIKPKILDLGTGSGAIALALASERPDTHIIASDYSEKALEVAHHNARKHALTKNISFIQSDWYTNINENDFDLIVSNPPYIDPQDPHLHSTIKYEPLQALVAENKGLADIETIIQQTKNHLKKGGFLVLEHGFDQAKIIAELFEEYKFSNSKSLVDLNHNPRITFAKV